MIAALRRIWLRIEQRRIRLALQAAARVCTYPHEHLAEDVQ